MISLPYTIIVVVITWVLSAGITYGVFKTRLDAYEERLDRIEEQFVPRREYDAGSANLNNWLTRIERKIDVIQNSSLR